jgi:HSP20 family protein
MVEVKKNFGSYLRRYREMADLTQGELAEELGVSRQSVIALESGKCIPSVALALKISRAFEMPVEFIFREQVDNNKGKEVKMARDLLPWSPLREIMSMRETIDRFFEEPSSLTRETSALFHPSVGIRETEKELVIEADIPGVKEEDIDVEVEDDKVIIRGERKHKEETKREDYYHLESSYGAFSRVIGLPSYVDADKAQAEVKDGMLEIVIPKVEKRKAKKLAVKKPSKK